MIFFNSRKNKEPAKANSNSKYNSVDIAYYLFSTLSVGKEIPPEYKETIQNELKLCDINKAGYADRQTLLNRVIELVGNPDTPKQRYLLAMAYCYSNSNYRQKAIEYTTLYLNNDLFEGAYNNIIVPTDAENPRSWVSPKEQHLCEMYSALGNAYLEEHMYQEALQSFKKANEFAPSYPSTYHAMAKTYTHMNDLQNALAVYQDAKKSPYYSIRKWYDNVAGKDREYTFWKDIDVGEKGIQEKIKKGYVYRPKKK